jgi:hypothetical protein
METMAMFYIHPIKDNPGYLHDAAAVRANPQLLVGQFRTLGGAGPVYEVLAVNPDQTVLIRIVHSLERIVDPLENVLNDEVATTL